jgi:hypothetical protein
MYGIQVSDIKITQFDGQNWEQAMEDLRASQRSD